MHKRALDPFAFFQTATSCLLLLKIIPLQGTSSNILVRLSNVYSQLRGDTSGIKNEDSAQVHLRGVMPRHFCFLVHSSHVRFVSTFKVPPASCSAVDDQVLGPAARVSWQLRKLSLVVDLLLCAAAGLCAVDDQVLGAHHGRVGGQTPRAAAPARLHLRVVGAPAVGIFA